MAYLNHAAVIFASLVCLFDSGSARFVAGRCKKPTAVYVNEDNFGGQWFEQKKYDTLREIGDICNFIQVSLVENESGLCFLFIFIHLKKAFCAFCFCVNRI